MKQVIDLLKKYSVDVERGFLPAQDPLTQLPSSFTEWEQIATNFTPFLNAGIIRAQLDQLPILESSALQTPAELERALFLLSFFAHAYVYAPPAPRAYIPAAIAIPWVKVAKILKRKPVISHANLVLNNWRRLDSSKPIQLDNLTTLLQFHGGLDESWFYLVTVEIEKIGAQAIPLVVEAMYHVAAADFEKATACLQQANPFLASLTTVLQKMYLFCDPSIFYLRIRPFVASLESIDFKGTGLPLQSHHGGSAAQSSLLQFFDAAFGVEYENSSTQTYLLQMRKHMPYPHATFLAYIEKTSQIKEQAAKHKALGKAYKEAIHQLLNFRNEHLKIVALYIMKPASKTKTSAKGTGGTNPMVFLKSVRNQTEELGR